MKLTIGRNELLLAAGSVIGAVERRSTLPVLQNFRLDAEGDRLVVTGTDLEIELVTIARANCDEPGTVTVPARKLHDIVRNLPEGAEIVLSVKDGKMQLKSGRSKFMLATLPSEQMPEMSFASKQQTTEIEVSQGLLKSLIKRCKFAIAVNDVRTYLCGLYLETRNNALIAVATDGHRLAMGQVEVPGARAGTSIILPRKSVEELERTLGNDKEMIKLRFNPFQMQVDAGDMRLTSKAIEGRFPDYDRVVPSAGPAPLLVKREVLRSSLARISIVANQTHRSARLALSEGTMSIEATGPEGSEAGQEILEVTYSGRDMEIGKKVDFMLEVLNAIDSEDVAVHVSNPESATLWMPADGTDGRYVIMPMRI